MPTHLDAHKAEFQAAIDHFHQELQGLRTGRASVVMVEDIRVEAYDGQSMDLKSVASLTTPDAKTIQIEPWDKSIVKNIEKALVDAALGMMPNTAGTVIRLALPPMTEDGRKNLVKILHQKEEVARVGLRNLRDKIRTAVTNDEKNKLMSEDDKHHQLEQLDKAVGEWNGKIEMITKEKETEILTV